ncbi:MAG: hypothetical protein CM15mP114_15710 [Alphaproteobacteria bacterium]|nr:MAG: hypothetical protein CM15mP114_15710 [Alphaproteobacteria bacterium]
MPNKKHNVIKNELSKYCYFSFLIINPISLKFTKINDEFRLFNKSLIKSEEAVLYLNGPL